MDEGKAHSIRGMEEGSETPTGDTDLYAYWCGEVQRDDNRAARRDLETVR